jgi:membrane fusion protein, multidrug efflux system
MAFRLRGSHISAMLIAGAVLGWMATGDVLIGGQAGSADAVPPPAERQLAEEAPFKVRYVAVSAEDRVDSIQVRGRTEAHSTVSVRAETGGTVRERVVEKGETVSAGDLVCRIDVGTRQSAVARAEATLSQAEFDYQASQRLQERGFAAETRLNALKAQRDGAQAELDQARQELARTEVMATARGIVQDPIAEPGDNLAVGDVCVTLIDTDPMLFVGQVSERRIGAVERGSNARVMLVSGEERTGTVRYVAPSADPQTRTFRVEITVPNDDGALRDGVTAAATLELDSAPAFRVGPSWLTLADDGTIGLSVIDAEDRVSFVPVEILSQGNDGVWVTGLSDGDRVITLGQDYVVSGQKVEPVAASASPSRSNAAAIGKNGGARS